MRALWDGIATVATPWMAAGDAAETKQASMHSAVGFNGLEKITRATRLEAAPAAWPHQPHKQRRDEQLISADQYADYKNHS
jgi:hypothetical protein